MQIFQPHFKKLREGILQGKLRWKLLDKNIRLFVSKHFEVQASEIEKIVVEVMKTEFKVSADGNRYEVKVCTLCSKGNKTNADNLWKLSIYKNGGYNCFRCGSHGNWFDLKAKAKNPGSSISSRIVGSTLKDQADDIATRIKIPPDQGILFSFSVALLTNPYNTPNITEAMDYLISTRGLNESILKKYGVGVSSNHFGPGSESEVCITFPWMISKFERPEPDISSVLKVIECNYAQWY